MSCAVSLETFTIDIDDAVLIRGGGGLFIHLSSQTMKTNYFKLKKINCAEKLMQFVLWQI